MKWVLLAFVAGAAVGYFVTPTKVVTKTVVQQTKQETQDIQKNKVFDKTETILPDGTKKIETKITDKSTDTTDSTSSSLTTSEKTVERSQSSLLVYGLAETKITSMPTYGAGVQRRVLGPLWLGAFGTTGPSVGVTVGLSF